jgi:hypothetical protein
VIERWLVAVRDHPDRPPALQCHILTMLALRMDWSTGRGFAGIRDLMADAAAGKATVSRATAWACTSQLLLCTRRGHYINAQTAIASEWQLTQPVTGDRLESQGLTREPLGQSQGLTREPLGQSQGLNGSNPRSQQTRPKVSVGTTHQESSTSQPSKKRSRPASQGQDHAGGQIRVGDPIADKTGSGVGRSAANSHNPRVHHGSNDQQFSPTPSGVITAVGEQPQTVTRARGTCPRCGRDMSLTEGGTIRRHQGSATRGYCHGSGELPARVAP